jgi:hypothetical protein
MFLAVPKTLSLSGFIELDGDFAKLSRKKLALPDMGRVEGRGTRRRAVQSHE